MRNLLNGLLNDGRSLLISGLIVFAIAFVLTTWARTRSLVPTLGALLLGAVVVGGVNAYTVIQTEVDQEIRDYTTTDNAPLAEELPQGGGGGGDGG